MNNTVIIAESSPAVAQSVARAFQDKGYAVRGIYADGVSALQAAKQMPPAIVTLDLILPRLSGLQLAMSLQKLSQPPLIIAISAVSSRPRLAQAKAAGVRYYILKPLANDKLHEVLQRQLGGATAQAVAGL